MGIEFQGRPDGAKTFHVFLGENGGSWDRYWAADGDGLVTVDGDWKTYTLTTEVDRSWENMKLGFEVVLTLMIFKLTM